MAACFIPDTHIVILREYSRRSTGSEGFIESRPTGRRAPPQKFKRHLVSHLNIGKYEGRFQSRPTMIPTDKDRAGDYWEEQT
jgi:hypothetical protein